MIYHDPYAMADIEPCDFLDRYMTNKWITADIEPIGNSFYDMGITRKSKVIWLEGEIQDELGGMLREIAANAEYNWVINELESIQLTRYVEGDFYTWHTDTNMVRRPTSTRKLSFTIWLNDPNEYEGGEFELWDGAAITDNDKRVTTLKEPKGKLVMFPSYTWHRVKTITKGTRYSLVGWIRGPEWT